VWYCCHTMVLCALLLAAATVPELEVTLSPAPARLSVQLAVNRELPEEWTDALGGGAPVSITYRLKLFRNRRWLWDQRLASHELLVKAQRDPLTGVFTLVAELDGDILASGQAETIEEAVHWVTHPPPAEIPVPLRHEPLWLVVRAEFLQRYTLFVFPNAVATGWVTRAVPEAP
jgi:Domain of unknown function (DUF4390)